MEHYFSFAHDPQDTEPFQDSKAGMRRDGGWVAIHHHREANSPDHKLTVSTWFPPGPITAGSADKLNVWIEPPLQVRVLSILSIWPYGLEMVVEGLVGAYHIS